MNDLPLVSVLMTAYNREQYLADAIESVLASDFIDFELIIVDDFSTDKTLEIARQYETKDKRISVFVNEQNLGDYPNRNKAASYARGKYIKYLDADDMIYPYGLGAMVAAMEQHPQAGFGLAAKPEDTRPYPVCIDPWHIYIESFNGYGHFDRAPGSAIIKREAFNIVNGFSGARMIGDYEFWLKIARYYPMVKFPLDLYWNRLHKGQEFQTKFAKDNYEVLTKNVLEAAFNHPDIPISKAELRVIRAKTKRAKQVKKILKLARKLKAVVSK